ncbi:MAG: hypothetical protein ACKVQQ_09410 [Burkholderiales bacterium]
MEVDASPKPAPVRVSTLVWLALFCAGTVWIFVKLVSAWPYVGHPLQMPLLVFVPGVLYCGFKAAYVWRSGKTLVGWRKWTALPLACVLGLFGAGHLWEAMDRQSMAGFASNIAPLVAAVESSRPNVCAPASPYRLSEEFRPYLESSRGLRSGLKIEHGAGRVVLSTGGFSADIDGSTLYYDLADRKWVKFHNDNREKRAAFEALTRDMDDCQIKFG